MKVGDLVNGKRRWFLVEAGRRNGIVIAPKNGSGSSNRILVVWPSGLKGWYPKKCLENLSESRRLNKGR